MVRETHSVVLGQRLTSAPLEDEADRFDILSRLRHHKLVFSCTFLLTLGFIGIIYAIAPRTYQGQASIIMATPEPLLGGVDPVVEERRGDQADLESQALVLHSLNLLQIVASPPAIAALVTRECQAKKMAPVERLREVFMPIDCGQFGKDKAATAEYLQRGLGVSEDGRSR